MKLNPYTAKIHCLSGLLWLLASHLCAQSDASPMMPGTFKAPYDVVFWQTQKYGWRNDTLYVHHPEKKRWQQLLLAPAPVRKAFVYQDQLILSSLYSQNLYRYDATQNQLLPFALPDGLLHGLGKKVQSLCLASGSYGCFHNRADSVIYHRRGKWFLRTNSGEKTQFANQIPQKIPAHTVEALVEALDYLPHHLHATPVADITAADVVAFRRLMDANNTDSALDSIYQQLREDYFFPESDSDLKLFLSLIDSVAMVDEQLYRELFRDGLGLISTTTHWRGISFQLDDERVLHVYNDEFMPLYQMTPWQVSFDGAFYEIHHGAFSSQLDALTQGQFLQQLVMEKHYAIYRIVCALYRRKKGEW
ncbi:MAG: hypothetical protein J0L99_01175 [Chitinophagales bacterium]|nr:hypothetical protein [Chitinophagales bacterium]